MLMNQSQVVSALNGTPVIVGTIVADATTAKTNTNTATPFLTTGMGSKVFLLQGDVAFYVLPTASATGLAAAATSILIAANERYIIALHGDYPYISILSQAGTATVRLFQLK